MRIYIGILFCASIFIPSTVANIGPLKICSRDDGNLNDCLKDSIQSALIGLKHGYNGSGISFPSLDPYYEQEVRLGYNLNQVNVEGKVANITCYGYSKAKVHSVRANLQDDTFDMEVDMSLKKLFVEGNYILDGNYFAIKVTSKGSFNVTMSGMSWTWRIKASPKKKHGKVYMILKDIEMRPELTNMDITIPVLIEGNPTIDRYLKSIIKSGWRVIYSEMLPVVEKLWSLLCTRLASRIFNHVPYDELFPPGF